METLTYTVIVLVAIGTLAAVILYFVAQKFKVVEDPRIDSVDEILPAANCGGCGEAGCRAFAEVCVKTDDLSSLFCPVGGNDTMSQIAAALGREAVARAPKIAVVRCSGSCENAPQVNRYDGAPSCAVASSLYGGETACSYGCLGCGDCVTACDFDAIEIDRESMLPVVVDEKCVACGACVTACPRNIIELRKKMPKFKKVFVSCQNRDKGAAARKACKVACIGCSKCKKECPFDAITVENSLAYIDPDKCKLCRKCVAVCPTSAILEVNFPPKKVKVEAPKVKPETPKVEATLSSDSKEIAEAKPKAESIKDNQN